jgi:hypothetical protein
VKKIRFHQNVAEEVRAIEQRAALNILTAIHRYAATGAGRVKPLKRKGETKVFLDTVEVRRSSRRRPTIPLLSSLGARHSLASARRTTAGSFAMTVR